MTPLGHLPPCEWLADISPLFAACETVACNRWLTGFSSRALMPVSKNPDIETDPTLYLVCAVRCQPLVHALDLSIPEGELMTVTQQNWIASSVRRPDDQDWQASITAQTEAVGVLLVSGLRPETQAQEIVNLAAVAPAMADLLAECVPGGLSEVRFPEWQAEVLRIFASTGIADSVEALIATRLRTGRIR
jgi:hypothetical protein